MNFKQKLSFLHEKVLFELKLNGIIEPNKFHIYYDYIEFIWTFANKSKFYLIIDEFRINFVFKPPFIETFHDIIVSHLDMPKTIDILFIQQVITEIQKYTH